MMKQGDYGTKLIFTIYDEDDEVLDLTAATDVNLVMLFNKRRSVHPCVVEDAENGTVSYIIQETDLDGSGSLIMEIEVAYGESQQFTSSTIKEKVAKKI